MAEYKPIVSVSFNNTDVELCENARTIPENRYCVYARENLSFLEEFHQMTYKPDLESALKSFANIVQGYVYKLQATLDEDEVEQHSGSQQMGGME